MSAKPYSRKQGEFELRVLKDGRLVLIAPDETLLEIAASISESVGPSGTAPGEQNAGKESAERHPAADPGRGEAANG